MRTFAIILFLQVIYINTMGQNKNFKVLEKGDYLVYWTSGGMKVPQYHKVFCITNTQLSIDISHNNYFIPGSISDLSLIPFNDSVYTQFVNIANEIPIELLEDSFRVKCSKSLIDCGTTYVLAQLKGKMYHWDFACKSNECSFDIQKFIADIRKTTYLDITTTIKK